MSPLLGEFLGAVIRWALSAVFGYLTLKKIITADQGARFTDGAVSYLLSKGPMLAMALAPLAWSLIAKYRTRIKFLTALEMPAGATEADVKKEIKQFGGPPMTMVLVAIALFATSACGVSTRHIAVQADASLAQVVFALDDAEFEACAKHVLTAAECDKLNPLIKNALVDVKALTAALQATRDVNGMPSSLSALVADVAAIRKALDELGKVAPPSLAPFLTKLQAVEAQVVALVQQFAGGQ